MNWYLWGVCAALMTAVGGLLALDLRTDLQTQPWRAIVAVSLWCGIVVAAVAFWFTRPSADTGLLRSPYNHRMQVPTSEWSVPISTTASPYAHANPLETA